jgi:HEAT repeat protein
MRLKVLAVLVVLGLFGCEQTAEHDRRFPPPPPPVPAAPTYHPVAIKPELVQEAEQLLITETQDANPVHESHALEALSEVDPADDAKPILSALSSPEAVVRFSAAMAAGQIKLVDAYPILRTMADDPDIQVEVAVRFALHRLGDTRLSHDLERFAASTDPHVRGTVAQVLGFLMEPSASKMLHTLVEDPQSAVRIQAAGALWKLGDEKGLEDLVAYAISAYPDDQMVALVALAQPRDQRVIQHVRGELQGDYLEVSLAPARALGMLGSDEGWTIAVPAAKSKDPRRRLLAALAMGAIGRSDLQEDLKPLLEDPEPTVRISAAMAILQLRE